MKFLLLLVAVVCNHIALSQVITRNAISSGGGTATAGNITLSYNIGEPVTDFLISTSGKFSVGFIQVDTDPNAITPAVNITSQLVVFPNPTPTGISKLDFKDIPDGSYQVDILDAIGHVLYTKTIAYAKNNNLSLDLNVTNFKGGTYYIRVKNGVAQGQVKLVKL